jgi:hypothetical protein
MDGRRAVLEAGQGQRPEGSWGGSPKDYFYNY